MHYTCTDKTLLTGDEWNEYFKDEYGSENVHWKPNSFDDIVNDPSRMVGYTESEMESILKDGWLRDAYGTEKTGCKFLQGDKSVFYHPVGGVHGGEYYGFSSGNTGKVKIVNPNTYIPLPGDKATVIYYNQW